MIYTAAQIEHWPRLLTAARAVDPTLADALKTLMMHGASLQLTQSGKLQIGAGTMPPEAYEVVKADKLLPRREKLYRLLGTARGLGHPWLQAVAAAYKDLAKRCELGDEALRKAATAKDVDRFRQLLPMVTDRHYQASLLAQSLYIGGFGQYEKAASLHSGTLIDRYGDIKQLELVYDRGAWGWPIQTDDGWFWVVDVDQVNGQPFIPPAVNLGAERGNKTWLDGEPLITDQELANALCRVETGMDARAS